MATSSTHRARRNVLARAVAASVLFVGPRFPSAHAEREAIRDAQRRLGRVNLGGSVLYSTSRPCRQCEIVAAEAQVARMVYGPELNDAGQPRR